MARVALVVASVALATAAASPRTAAAGQLARRAGLYITTASPPSPTPSAAPALPMSASHFDLAIRGPLVTGTITQTFRNDTARVVEATYVFPLPSDAAVSAMAIDVGTRHVHAEIARRADAAQRYEDAVAAGVGAGLVEQERGDVFTQTVSAIPAHGTVTVTLRFDCAAHLAAGEWELALPLVVAPRFVPGTASGRATTGTGRAPDTARAPDASRVTPGGAPQAGGAVEVALEFADDVDAVHSPSHELRGAARSFTLVDPHGDHDAVVRWRLHDRARGWVERDGGAAYAAIVVETPAPPPRAHAVHALFVVDRAVTTRGDGDAVLRPFAHALLAAATREDRLALAGVVTAAEQSADAARRALDEAWPMPGGARDLTAELAALHPAGAAIVLASDGLVADDAAALAAAKRLGVRVHVIGIGPAPNRALLAAIARATAGTLRFALPGDDLATIARDVLADLAAPPSPVAVTWGALRAGDVEPAALVLGAGQGALVVAQVALPSDGHALSARSAGDIFTLGIVTAPRAPDGATTTRGPLARWWSRARLDELVVAGNRAAVAAHALAAGLVSPETSMLAVGDEVIAQGGVKHTVAVPVSVPAGMHWQEVRHALDVAVDTNEAKPARDARLSDHTDREHSSDRDSAPPSGGAAQPGKAGPRDGKAKNKSDKAEEDEWEGDDGDHTKSPTPHKPPAKPDEPFAKSSPAKKLPGPVVLGRVPTAPTTPAPEPAPSPTATPPPPPPTATPPAPPPVANAVTAPAPEVVVNGSTQPAGADIAVAAPSAPTEVLERAELVSLAGARGSRSWRPVLSLSLAGGLAVTAGQADGLAAARARVAWGWPLAFGAEGSLWIVGGLHLQGDVLATLERTYVMRFLALGAGIGAHFGDGIGPAGELQLRVPLRRTRWSPYLRYDGAILIDNSATHGLHAVTLGVQADF